MTETTMDKARLAAFVDGELSPEDAAEVVMHLSDHPIDQAYVDELMTLSVLIGDAYDAPLHEPVPPAILATIAADGEAPASEARVIQMTRRAPARRIAAWGGGAALAAGIAGFLIVANPEAPDSMSVAIGPLPAASIQSLALNELETGGARTIVDGVDFSVTASFETVGKGVCREFRVARREAARLDMGIACPSGNGGWRIETVDSLAMSEVLSSFTPASGGTDDPISDFLDSAGAGRALTPAEEAKAKAQNWLSGK